MKRLQWSTVCDYCMSNTGNEGKRVIGRFIKNGVSTKITSVSL